MRLDLTVHEAELLERLLDAVTLRRRHELHHTDSREFRKLLHEEVELIDSIRAKLTGKFEAA